MLADAAFLLCRVLYCVLVCHVLVLLLCFNVILLSVCTVLLCYCVLCCCGAALLCCCAPPCVLRCLRHIYVESMHYASVSKAGATFGVFFVSAVFHELMFSVAFKVSSHISHAQCCTVRCMLSACAVFCVLCAVYCTLLLTAHIHVVLCTVC